MRIIIKHFKYEYEYKNDNLNMIKKTEDKRFGESDIFDVVFNNSIKYTGNMNNCLKYIQSNFKG